MKTELGGLNDDPRFLINKAGDEAAANGASALDLRRAAELAYLALTSAVSKDGYTNELNALKRIARQRQIPSLPDDYVRLRRYLHSQAFHFRKGQHGSQGNVIYFIGLTSNLIEQLLTMRRLNK